MSAEDAGREILSTKSETLNKFQYQNPNFLNSKSTVIARPPQAAVVISAKGAVTLPTDVTFLTNDSITQ